MRKHSFTPAERYAVFVTHGDRCYLGRELLDMTTFQIDHIIPEHLQEDPRPLQKAIESFGLPDDFNLNSFENWLPACGSCNNRKRASVFEPVPIIKIELQKPPKGQMKREKLKNARYPTGNWLTRRQ